MFTRNSNVKKSSTRLISHTHSHSHVPIHIDVTIIRGVRQRVGGGGGGKSISRAWRSTTGRGWTTRECHFWQKPSVQHILYIIYNYNIINIRTRAQGTYTLQYYILCSLDENDRLLVVCFWSPSPIIFSRSTPTQTTLESRHNNRQDLNPRASPRGFNDRTTAGGKVQSEKNDVKCALVATAERA
jgi:hypothetical protein